MSPDDFPPGSVWLVGAGPGDPELLTRKAERLLRAADIVFHDALVGTGVLALIPLHVELVSVGKRSGRHSKAQDTIDRLLVEAALAGKRVLRLKGGDPSIFGRSAEELSALAEAGVPVRICAGVTAASAAAASAAISLTLREDVRALIFVTAHAREGQHLDLDWATLASRRTGLAIYMGRAAADEIARNLIAAGLTPETPVLIAINASLPDERIIRGRLDALGFLVRATAEREPVLLLVGAMAGHGRDPCLAAPSLRFATSVPTDRDTMAI